MNLFIEKNVIPDSVLFTDQSNTYQGLHRHVDLHLTEKSSRETTTNMLKWDRIALSNCCLINHQMTFRKYLRFHNFFNIFASIRNPTDTIQI